MIKIICSKCKYIFSVDRELKAGYCPECGQFQTILVEDFSGPDGRKSTWTGHNQESYDRFRKSCSRIAESNLKNKNTFVGLGLIVLAVVIFFTNYISSKACLKTELPQKIINSTEEMELEQLSKYFGNYLSKPLKVQENRKLSLLNSSSTALIKKNFQYLGKAGENFRLPFDVKPSSKYGNRKHPIYKKELFHGGVDLPRIYGSEITAALSGTVVFSGKKAGYGKTVIIEHTNGFSTVYAHCLNLNVRNGQKVKQGELIGLVGMSGRVTGPHLHFELKKNGRPVNPEKFYDYKKLGIYSHSHQSDT